MTLGSRIRHRLAVWKRLAQLDNLIVSSNHTRASWLNEKAYIERTDRLDWVDPYPMPKPRPAGSTIKPPPQSRK